MAKEMVLPEILMSASFANMPELPYAVDEAINRLRINMEFMGDEVRKILVVSTLPNEGKSFIAMQLWRKISESGKECVLVDGDLRKSVMVTKYELTRDDGKRMRGMSNLLAGSCKVEDVLFQTNIRNGYIAPNTENAPRPALLFQNGRMEKFLNLLASEYPATLIDIAPLNLVSDGELVGSFCDGAILVVREGVTPRNMVRTSIRQLERAGCPLLGIVLNRVENSHAGYYSKRYGKYGYYGKKHYGYGGYGDQAYYTDSSGASNS